MNQDDLTEWVPFRNVLRRTVFHHNNEIRDLTTRVRFLNSNLLYFFPPTLVIIFSYACFLFFPFLSSLLQKDLIFF